MANLEKAKEALKQFYCPECKKPLNHVSVYGEAYQRGLLDGNQIVDYDNTEVIGGITEIECPQCTASLTRLILE